MFEAPEGYVVERMGPECGEDIVQIALQIYRRGEPLCDYIGMTEDDLEELLKPLLLEWINEGISLAAKCTTTETIVGLLIGKPITKDDLLLWGKYNPESERAGYYAKVCSILELGVDVSSYYGVDRVLDHSFLAVHNEHRGKGIGTALAKAMEEIGRSQEIKASAVTASNKYTAQIYQKLGFEVLFQYDYEQLEINGKKLFDLSVSNGSTCAQVLGKKV